MKITTELPLDGTTEEIIQGIITHCANKLAYFHTFGYHTQEDIFQQCWVIAIEAINSRKYDEDRPLEKFLYRHLERRLKTFFRDQYFRKMRDDESRDSWEIRTKRKTSLMNPATEYDNDEIDDYSFEEHVDLDDFSGYIRRSLPEDYREIYDRVIIEDLVGIPKATIAELRNLIEEILPDA